MNPASFRMKPLDLTPVTYICCMRSTHSDVMSIKNTYRIGAPVKKRNGELRRIEIPIRTQKKTAFNITSQINATHANLVRERDEFFAHLNRKRDERLFMETNAAINIQRIFRGHAVRRDDTTDQNSIADSIHEDDLKNDIENIMKTTHKRIRLREKEIENSKITEQGKWKIMIEKREARKLKKQQIIQKRYNAAVTIQRVIRRMLERRIAMEEMEYLQDELDRNAALRIQSVARVVIARNMTQIIRENLHNKCACIIQRSFRAYMGRAAAREAFGSKKIHENRALQAILVQAAFRGFRTRKQQVLNQKEPQAITIQRFVRQKLEKIRGQAYRERLHHSATLAQALARGKLARDRVANIRKELENERREHAAVSIQCAIRSRKARHQTRERRSARDTMAATKMQKVFRGRQARVIVQKKKEEIQEKNAAVKIQSIYRGRQDAKKVAKIRFKRDTKAAETIQRQFKIKMAKETLAKKKAEKKTTLENNAATKIQHMFLNKKALSKSKTLREDRTKRFMPPQFNEEQDLSTVSNLFSFIDFGVPDDSGVLESAFESDLFNTQ
eukprot:TRINITY_DN2507_c0_g3_i1.p1 TRINITY_DN2507_c0_g3~~TRINITY_DN2507_c0_g3_i1.p1  ORF type:complete len:559 (+),score=139.79 TRINITY_DN2507_c0_g3_i1:93-1769(+)